MTLGEVLSEGQTEARPQQREDFRDRVPEWSWAEGDGGSVDALEKEEGVLKQNEEDGLEAPAWLLLIALAVVPPGG